MMFSRTSLGIANSIGEKEFFIFMYFLFYMFQVGYLYNSYTIPVLLIISGVKSMLALASFSKTVDSLKKAFTTQNKELRGSSLFMATVFFTGAIAVLLIKW